MPPLVALNEWCSSRPKHQPCQATVGGTARYAADVDHKPPLRKSLRRRERQVARPRRDRGRTYICVDLATPRPTPKHDDDWGIAEAMKHKNYVSIEPQFLATLSDSEASAACCAIIESIPRRCGGVIKRSGIPASLMPWDGHSTRRIMNYLSEWLVDTCAIRKISESDIKRIASGFGEPIRTSVIEDLSECPWDLSSRSKMLCTNVCFLYLEVCRTQTPRSCWTFSEKRSDYFRYVPCLKLGESRSFPLGIQASVIESKLCGKCRVSLYSELEDARRHLQSAGAPTTPRP